MQIMAARACMNRRQVLGSALIACLLSPIPGMALARSGMPGSQDVQQDSRTLMGTQVDITLQHDDAILRDAALQAAWAEMTRLVRMMSRYEAGSGVAMLQRAAGGVPVPVPAELMAVLRQAQQVARLSDGAFDVTVGAYAQWRFEPGHVDMPTPAELAAERALVNHRHLLLDTVHSQASLKQSGMRLDLGGIAKLPILQAGMAVLTSHGVCNAMINGGGDVITAGSLHGRDWRIGIRDAHAPARLLGVVAMRDGIVASSGDYERSFERNGRHYHHILDPRSGLPTQGPHGVVLVARGTEVVNGRGAALMGAQTAQRDVILRELKGQADVLIFERDQSRWMTPGMARRLQMAPRA